MSRQHPLLFYMSIVKILLAELFWKIYRGSIGRQSLTS